MNYLEFEKPLAEIEGKAEELRAMARQNEKMDVEKEAAALDRKAAEMLRDLYRNLDAWQKCQVARHPDRPHCKDYIDTLFTEFTALAGDRNFADDHAVMGGIARFKDQPVVVIGSLPPHVDIDNVRADSAAGVGLALDHLVAHGRREIAFVNGPIDTVPGSAAIA